MIEFDKNPIFEMACNVRPIRAFHPEILLETDTTSLRRYLSPDAKLLWFYQYCSEQGLQGKVDTTFVSSEELKDIPYNEVLGGMASLKKEFWSATVYIGSEAVSTAMASGTFIVNDASERDFASNQLRKSAIGSALSQAGFGIVSGFGLTAADIDRLNTVAPAGTPISAPAPAAAPISMPAPAPAQIVQDDFFGSRPTQPAATVNGTQMPVMAPAPQNANVPIAAPAAPAPVDPLAAAKQTVWTGGGRFKGRTLGEILSDLGGANNIAWIANEYSPRTPDGHKVKDAAKVILASLETGT